MAEIGITSSIDGTMGIGNLGWELKCPSDEDDDFMGSGNHCGKSIWDFWGKTPFCVLIWVGLGNKYSAIN